jgi:hypothetical protein
LTDFDSPWKEALDPLDLFFEPFLLLFFPGAHRDIDWRRGTESLDKELQQVVREAEIGRRYVDKLVKVWLKDGHEQWVLIHVEVQSSEDPDFEVRMYRYNYRLYDKYNKQVASFAILGDDNLRWRPDSLSYNRWGVTAGLWFPAIKLLDYREKRAELEASENPFAVVVMAHLDTLETRHDPRERKGRLLRLIRRLYERGPGRKLVFQLLRIIDWMMELPKPLELELREEVDKLSEENKMPHVTSFERLAKEEGLEEGLEIGRRLGLIESIDMLLRDKFGGAAESLLNEIRAIENLDKLKAIFAAIKTAATADDLRRLWNGSSSN